jgi:epsin
MNHVWDRLKLEQQEWRKIFKALHLLEVILKVGDPQCISSVKGNIYKIKGLQSFTTKAGSDKSAGIREKAKIICELVEDPDRLEEEREKTREIRNKLSGSSYSSGNSKTN